MLKIQNNEFEIKFTEINIRQRMYQNESYITLIINTEFYPSLVEENIISGSIDAKIDLKDIKSLDDLTNKNYKGEMVQAIIFIQICAKTIYLKDLNIRQNLRKNIFQDLHMK